MARPRRHGVLWKCAQIPYFLQEKDDSQARQVHHSEFQNKEISKSSFYSETTEKAPEEQDFQGDDGNQKDTQVETVPNFPELPAPPTLIPRTMLIAAKKSVSLPTQWWYQFQNL
ncbi:hypothetical protein EJB05_17413, partial [Eragrostis curvula]